MTEQPNFDAQTTLHDTQTKAPPELLQVDCETLGDHGMHWEILSERMNTDVPKWLEQSIDDAVMPRGLAHEIDHNTDESAANWLITGPEGVLQVAQILDIEDGRPTALRSAYPFIDSQRFTPVKVSRVLHCEHSLEAVLTLETADGSTVYAFDALYTVNQHRYQSKTIYNAYLGALAYELERVGTGETIVVDDPAAIRHHRALNEILANNGGVAPDDLQAKLEAWQPKTPDDEAPVTLDLSNMVAYLFGENFGQEDEAWFQGEVLGAAPLAFMDRMGQLLDVVILREPDAKPLVIQIAYFPRDSIVDGKTTTAPTDIKVGEYIRGNIWLQAAIYAAG